MWRSENSLLEVFLWTPHAHMASTCEHACIYAHKYKINKYSLTQLLHSLIASNLVYVSIVASDVTTERNLWRMATDTIVYLIFTPPLRGSIIIISQWLYQHLIAPE